MKTVVTKSLVVGSMALATLFASAPAFATCDDMMQECVTAGGATAAGTASGVYALKKYKDASGFEASNTKSVAEFNSAPQPVSASQIESFGQEIQEGDKVVVHYQLSEKENRMHHVSVMERAEADAHASAANYRTQALQASMPRNVLKSVPDGKGGTTMQNVMVPGDQSQVLLYSNMANSSDAEALRFAQKAADARAGGPVPLYNLNQEFKEASGTRTSVSQFLNERMAAKGKVIRVTRLPAMQFAQAKKMVWAARGGVAGAAIGLGVAAEQVFSGVTKDKYDSYSNDKSYGSYGSYSNLHSYGTAK